MNQPPNDHQETSNGYKKEKTIMYYLWMYFMY